MAAAAITANYEIGHNLKSIQVRDPFFILDPCFQEQGMQWSYHLHYKITKTTPKSKMAAAAIRANYEIGHAMKLSFTFYDHSNYLNIKMAAVWVEIGVLRLNTFSRGIIL